MKSGERNLERMRLLRESLLWEWGKGFILVYNVCATKEMCEKGVRGSGRCVERYYEEDEGAQYIRMIEIERRGGVSRVAIGRENKLSNGRLALSILIVSPLIQSKTNAPRSRLFFLSYFLCSRVWLFLLRSQQTC